MARFDCFRKRTVVMLFVLTLLMPSLVLAQYTSAWVDATSPVYTSGTSGDMCRAINNAYLSANFTGTVDARGFTGTQACTVNPFDAANKPVELLLNRTVNIVTGVRTPARMAQPANSAPKGPNSTAGPDNWRGPGSTYFPSDLLNSPDRF